jgi:hypothetical protein
MNYLVSTEGKWISLLPEGMGISRLNMPQIDSPIQFRDWLFAQHDIIADPREYSAQLLRPMQANADTERLYAIYGHVHEPPLPTMTHPLIVSEDRYILDGHHRWISAMERGAKCDCIVYRVPGQRLYDLAREYPLVHYERPDER